MSASNRRSEQSEVDLETSTQSSQKKLGSCAVCLRQISLTSSGVIHSHGHGRPCAGSGCLPATSSVSTSSTSQPGIVAPAATNHPSTASVVSSPQLDSQTLLDNVVSARCRLLKYIPKASRIQAATNLTVILNRILLDPWQPVATFSAFHVWMFGSW